MQVFQVPLTPATSGNSLSEMAADKDTPQLSQSIIVNQWSEEKEKSFPVPLELFTKNSVAIVWGMQPRAVQGMLDFDQLCSREKPSVVAMVYTFRYIPICY